MTSSDLALVVPCYNEAARLDAERFLEFVNGHPGVHLVMVDDGSVDGTGEIIERMRAAAPTAVTTVRHSERRGKGEAVRSGILAGIDAISDIDPDVARSVQEGRPGTEPPLKPPGNPNPPPGSLPMNCRRHSGSRLPPISVPNPIV